MAKTVVEGPELVVVGIMASRAPSLWATASLMWSSLGAARWRRRTRVPVRPGGGGGEALEGG